MTTDRERAVAALWDAYYLARPLEQDPRLGRAKAGILGGGRGRVKGKSIAPRRAPVQSFDRLKASSEHR